MSCDASGEELYGGDEEPSGCRRDGLFEVLGEASVSAEPCQRSLDDPPAGQDFEALRGIGPLDDFDGPFTYAPQCLTQLLAGIAAIGKEMAQPGEAVHDLGEQQRRAVTILDVGSVDKRMDQIALGVGQDMPFAALDLLAGT